MIGESIGLWRKVASLCINIFLNFILLQGQEWKSEKETCIIAFIYVRHRTNYCGILANGKLAEVEVRHICSTLSSGSFVLQDVLHTFTSEETSLIEANFNAKITRASVHLTSDVDQVASTPLKQQKESPYALRDTVSISRTPVEDASQR